MEMRKLVGSVVIIMLMLGLEEVGEARPLPVLESLRGDVPPTRPNPCDTVPKHRKGKCLVKHKFPTEPPLSHPPSPSPAPPHFAAH